MTENEIIELAERALESHALKGWTFSIVDECGQDGDAYGYTYTDPKLIVFNRRYVGTYDHNVHELIRHEVAHALAGHGEHNDEWQTIYASLGGCGVWLDYDEEAISHENAHHR